jgi:protein phosphatase
LRIEASGRTDTGLKREGNEDAFSSVEDLGLYIVADGMGGHRAGEVASRIAVETIRESYKKWAKEKTPEEDIFGVPDASLSPMGNFVRSSIRLANRIIFELATDRKEYEGMGTTIVVLLISPDLIIAANVGDSRLYLVRDGNIERLSKDHTIVSEQIELGIMTEEDAASSPMKHILTRTLGSSEDVDAEVFEIEPSEHDRFVLCTDGITDLIKDEEILSMTQEEESPESLCQQFIDTVLDRGAHDNATVISVFLSGEGDRRRGTLGKIGGSMASLLRGKPKSSTITGG